MGPSWAQSIVSNGFDASVGLERCRAQCCLDVQPEKRLKPIRNKYHAVVTVR